MSRNSNDDQSWIPVSEDDQDHDLNFGLSVFDRLITEIRFEMWFRKPSDEQDQISIKELSQAMKACYNLSGTFAILFAIVGTFRLGKWFGFNLQELGVHGKIEHDASFSRHDVSLVTFLLLNVLDHIHRPVDELNQWLIDWGFWLFF